MRAMANTRMNSACDMRKNRMSTAETRRARISDISSRNAIFIFLFIASPQSLVMPQSTNSAVIRNTIGTANRTTATIELIVPSNSEDC